MLCKSEKLCGLLTWSFNVIEPNTIPSVLIVVPDVPGKKHSEVQKTIAASEQTSPISRKTGKF